jgi:hypothetical protein
MQVVPWPKAGMGSVATAAGPRGLALAAATAVAGTVLATAACGSPGTAADRPAVRSSSPGPATPPQPTRSASPSPSPKATHPPRPAKVVVSRFRAQDGSVVALATFRGPVTYRLHSGSSDPGHLSVLRAGPAVTGGERHRLLAAFNGGFLLSAGAGGYEQEGHVISPLMPGLASLVIDQNGSAQIESWRHGLLRSGEPVTSVRQNLRLLVRQGQVSPAAADWGAWGATLGGGEYVARSALGQDAAGELIFAGSMSASPVALAQALVHAGARSGMELDINPEWVQLDVARKPGHGLRAAIPGQQRPANQYLAGWTRDFITVLAPR